MAPVHKKIRFILQLSILLACYPVFGQQSQPYTQYFFDRFLVNPAACAANGFTSVGLTVKDQWTAFPGAPSNQVLFGQIRLSGSGKRFSGSGYSAENVGLGISLFNDKRGYIRTTGGQFTYAYHLPINKGQLSFGLSLNMFQLFVDRNKLVTETDDVFLNGANLNNIVPDIHFGLHYTTEKYYIGVAGSNIFQSYMMLGGRNSSAYRIERQYSLLGGYIIDLSEEWSMVPAVQVRFNDRLALQADFNVLTYYYDLFWAGLSYRTGYARQAGNAGIMIGARYKQFCFGYTYEHTLNTIRKYSYGSHEVMAVITFGQDERFFRFKHGYEFTQSRRTGR
jgi:type IX secretion system PorP/SprF family membrane protein